MAFEPDVRDGYHIPRAAHAPLPKGMLVPDLLESMLNEEVVLDTATTIVYLGTLAALTSDAFVLTEADMHDFRDGHALKDVYLAEARTDGITANRRRVVVLRSVVISVSRLTDVVAE